MAFNLNPEADIFVPKALRPLPAIKEYYGPDHLVGIAFRHLTEHQSFELTVWRAGQGRCTTCGHPKHHELDCPKTEKVLDIRRARKQCVYCGSHTHEHDEPWVEDGKKCPMNVKMMEALGPRSKLEHLLPKTHRDIFPSQYTAADREFIHNWMLENSICLFCEEEHAWHSCPKRLAHVAAVRKRKQKAVARGQLVIRKGQTGLFDTLPLELRLDIFKRAFKNDEKREVIVRPGYIPLAIRKAGFDHHEALEGWISSNTFRIDSHEALTHFMHLLKAYKTRNTNLFNHVHALHLSYDGLLSYTASQGYDNWFNVALRFPNLRKLALPAPSNRVCGWDGLVMDDNIGYYVEKLKLKNRFADKRMKSIKGLMFVLYYSYGAKRQRHSDLDESCEALVEKVEALLAKVDRPDVYVAAVVYHPNDEEWNAI